MRSGFICNFPESKEAVFFSLQNLFAYQILDFTLKWHQDFTPKILYILPMFPDIFIPIAVDRFWRIK